MPEAVALHHRSGVPWRLAWEGGRVLALHPAPGARPLPDLVLAPALCDLQVNGYGGHDLAAPDAVAAVVRALAARGVARFLPTVTTAAPAAMERALRAIAAAAAAPDVGPAIPGIHLEGPFLSPQDGPRGAHPREHVRPPDWALFASLQEAARGRIRLVTVAPELPGAIAFIARACRAGVAVAIGHTAAGGEAVRAAAAAGARLSTHLGNGLAAELHRHQNPIWPQLDCDLLHASLIADGHHLPPDVLRAICRAKGAGRCVLVSDAVREAGLPPGRYPGIGGAPVEVRADGRVSVPGTPYLAGSGAHLLSCVRHAVEVGAASLPDALEMASLRPARLLGLPAGGAAAGDVLLLRTGEAWEALLLARGGAVVHEAAGPQAGSV
jgi:N-acetylglucosamine-6-phosphate deacetylase